MKYDLEYYELMLRKYSLTAAQLAEIRWNFLSRLELKTVLDYGSGVGWFRAWRPKGVEVDTYDIADYPQTGIRFVAYDCVCFWDVLEHIPDFSEIEPALRLARNVAGSIPIKPNETDYAEWVHFKPGEHLHFWTEETLDALFRRYGFEKVCINTPECPPRHDILSFIYRENK